MAVFFGLKAFCSRMKSVNIYIYLVNSTTVNYGKHIILQSWRHGTFKWITFCSSQQIDCVSPTLSQALDFLVEQFKNGIGYSGINSARSSLSHTCIINPLALTLQLKGSSVGVS